MLVYGFRSRCHRLRPGRYGGHEHTDRVALAVPRAVVRSQRARDLRRVARLRLGRADCCRWERCSHLSLVFLDQAPSRFQLALRTGTVESLEERMLASCARPRRRQRPSRRRDLLRLVAQLSSPRPRHGWHAGASERHSYALRKQLRLPGARARLAELGGAPARHREARSQPRDPEQGGVLPRMRTGRASAGIRSRRDARRVLAVMARRVGRCRRVPPRALGRNRLRVGWPATGSRALAAPWRSRTSTTGSRPRGRQGVGQRNPTPVQSCDLRTPLTPVRARVPDIRWAGCAWSCPLSRSRTRALPASP